MRQFTQYYNSATLGWQLGLSRTLLNTQQVIDLLDDGEDADFEMDDCWQ